MRFHRNEPGSDPRPLSGWKGARALGTNQLASRRWIAVVCAVTLLACDASDPLEDANALLAEARVEEALELLRAELDENGSDPEVLHVYGRALIANGQPGLAAWPLQRSFEDPEFTVESGLLLAFALTRTNNNDEAARIASRVLELEPESLQALRTRSVAFLQARDHPSAIDDLDRLIEAFPEDLQLRENKFNSLRELEDFDAAAETLEGIEAIIQQRDDLGEEAVALLCAKRAGLEQSRGDSESASEVVEGCIAEHPTSRPVLNQALDFFGGQRDEDRALEIVGQYAERSPGDLAIQSAYALRLYESGDVDAGAQVLRSAAERAQTPGAWLALRNYYLDADDLDGAKEATNATLRTLTGAAPGEAGFDFASVPEQVLFESAEVLAIAGDYDLAKEMAGHLEEPAYRFLIEARIEYEQDRLPEALEVWEKAFTTFPSNSGARYLAGLSSLRQGDVRQGIEHLRASLRANAAATDAGMVLAQLNVARGLPGDAMDGLSHHVAGHPRDVEALRMQARLAYRLGSAEMAIQARDSLAVVLNRNGEAVADHARDIAAAHGPERALALLEDETFDLDDPANVEALVAWVEAMMQLERLPEAIERTAALTEQHPEVADVRAAHGMALSAAGRDDEALALFESALALKPDHPQALMAKARLDVAAGRIDQAVEGFTRAAEEVPYDPTPHYEAAQALADADRDEEAQERYRALLLERPWEGMAAWELAQRAVEAGKTDDETLELARRAGRFFVAPGSAAFETLGQLRQARGELEEAKLAYRRGVVIGSGQPSRLFRMAESLRELGDNETATEALQIALRSEDFPERDQALESLEALGGSLEEAQTEPAGGA